MLDLANVTLIGIDCLNIERLLLACEISKKKIRFGEIKMLSSIPCSSPYIISINPLSSINEYSQFMIKNLYDYVNTPFALVIQWDGFVLNPRAWSSRFFDYDYIGAPWKNHHVGNGGFSLRSRSLLKQLAKDKVISTYYPEDIMICKKYRKYLEEKGFVFAPENIAIEFSVEAQPWNNQFGFHQTDISKFNLQTSLDRTWHSLLVETYVSIQGRRIEIQGF
ncbi:DUF5672 family protein [Compostibacter hankyongensis]|uniref:DUF5672 domain-containing protein n=1 Tax=Compostibacter hankyongensis TaxID=1007089 RepID=A0ABP8FS95_9BACT